MTTCYSKLFCQIFFATCLLLTVFSACNNLPEPVKATLNTTSNRAELLKVIAHYQERGETQKVDAAYFLIKNLREQMHVEGDGVIHKRKMLRKIAEIPQRLDLFNKWDSLTNLVGKTTKLSVSTVYDSDIMKSELLIKHIDAAFKAWRYPWARSLSFEEFCDYILPYKLVNEEPTLWNEIVQQKTKWLLDSNKDEKDVYKVCISLNDYLKKQFYFQKFPISWDMNFQDLLTVQCGSCYHATQFTTYYMRALGIPVVMDFTPLWGNMNGGHNWNALIYKGKPVAFVGAESDPGQTKIDLAFQRKRGKIFRYTFLTNDERINKREKLANAPTFLKDPNIVDVTSDYIPVTTITVRPSLKMEEKSLMFLCVFNSQQWIPLDWAEVTNGTAVFKSMGRGILYMPMRFEKRILVPVAEPIMVDVKGNLSSLSSLMKNQTPVVLRKKSPQGPKVAAKNEYELYHWKRKWVSMGKKVAAGDSLIFTLPQNGLYWLKSSDKASKERIFTLKGGAQVWW